MACRRAFVCLVIALAMISSSTEGAETSAPPTTSSASASTGPGGGIDGGSPVPGEELLAAECEEDADCGPELGGICIRASDDTPLGGGPPGGYCSRACSVDSECPGLHSACIKDDASGVGRCFLGCEVGPPAGPGDAAAPLSEQKCRGREVLRCSEPRPFLDIVPAHVCLPACGKDAQCPAGRKCDPRDGVCVTTPRTGLPLSRADGRGARRGPRRAPRLSLVRRWRAFSSLAPGAA